MKPKEISIVICDFPYPRLGTLDLKSITKRLSELDEVREILLLEKPWKNSSKALKGLKGRKILFVGFTDLERTGFFEQAILDLHLNEGDYMILDMKRGVLDMYDTAQSAETNLYLQIRTSTRLLADKETLADAALEIKRKALVYGSGISGLAAANRLAKANIPVDILQTSEEPAGPGCLGDLYGDPGLLERLREETLGHDNVVLIPAEQIAGIASKQGKFILNTGGTQSQEYGAFIFAPERVEGPAPEPGALNLSDLYGKIRSGQRLKGTLVFLLDHGTKTSPEIFRDAMTAALYMRKMQYMDVWVLLQNVQVCRQGQEELYTSCREAGVLFIKYADDLSIKSDYGDFFLSGLDTQTGAEFQIQHPEIMIIPAKASLAPSAVSLADVLRVRLLDEAYSQPDSLWRLPNETNRSGVFTAGGARGNMNAAQILEDADSLAMSVRERFSRDRISVKERIPEVDKEKCVYCLTCVRVCPFGAMIKNIEERVAGVDPAACEACGICVAECPAEAMQVRNFSNDTLYSGVGYLAQ